MYLTQATSYLDLGNTMANNPTKPKPWVKFKSTPDVPGNTNGMDSGQSGDDDAACSRGKVKQVGSTCWVFRSQSMNAVAGPSQPEWHRRPPKRPDANVPTLSPKRHHK